MKLSKTVIILGMLVICFLLGSCTGKTPAGPDDRTSSVTEETSETATDGNPTTTTPVTETSTESTEPGGGMREIPDARGGEYGEWVTAGGKD